MKNLLLILLIIIIIISGCANQYGCRNSISKKELEEQFYNENFLGLEKGTYQIVCSYEFDEKDCDRSYLLKIKKDNKISDYYSCWRHGSSSGAGAGGETAFISEDEELYEYIKDLWCNQIFSYQYEYENGSLGGCDYPDETIMVNTTNETIQKCLAGEFEETINGTKIIAIAYWGGRCSSGYYAGNFTEMFNKLNSFGK